MHRIALFSDVHGNLPALKAVLADIDARRVDSMFCLGDLVDFAPWPNEVIELLRRRMIPTLLGNHDERIAFDLPVVTLKKHTEAERTARVDAIDWTRRAITAENKAYLGGLPRWMRLSFGDEQESLELLLTHASPRAIDEYLFEDHPEEELQEQMVDAGAHALVVGHTHFAYVRMLEGNEGRRLMAINCGSVGRLKERAPLASYAILTIRGASVEAEIVRVPYAIEETIRGIRQSGIPEFYADFLERRGSA